MPKLDKNDAPEGYIAVEVEDERMYADDICVGCHFDDESCPIGYSCSSYARKDGKNVIFIKAKPEIDKDPLGESFDDFVAREWGEITQNDLISIDILRFDRSLKTMCSKSMIVKYDNDGNAEFNLEFICNGGVTKVSYSCEKEATDRYDEWSIG